MRDYVGEIRQKTRPRRFGPFESVGQFKKVLRYYYIKKDLKLGYSWTECCVKHSCSRPVIQTARRYDIGPDELEYLRSRDKSPEKGSEEQAAREDTNLKLNPLEFAEDPKHLNIKLFPMQRIILKCYYGIKLNEAEQAQVDKLVKQGKCTWKGERDYRELVLVVGMKGSKTALAGVIACIEEYRLYQMDDFRKHYKLPEGKEIFILNVATNEDQARMTIFAETERIIKNSPYYKRRTPGSTSTLFIFDDNNVKMLSGHSNSSALVGTTCKAVLLDELDRFTTKKEGRSSGKRMYTSITRNTTPFGLDGKIVSISSPMWEGGPIMKLFEMSKGEETMLGFWLATWEMNPNYPFDGPVMQAELRKSPEDFWRDYGAQPSRSLEKYYRDRNKIDAVFERAKTKGIRNPIKHDGTFHDEFKGDGKYDYHIHLDPSVKNDCFGIAMAHNEEGYIIADLVHRFKPTEGEINYEDVKQFLLLLADRFPTIRTVTYDIYLAISLYQSLQEKLNIEATFLNIDKKIHDKLKIEAIYTGRLSCHPHRYLREELRSLELVGGKKVDHPEENEEGGRGSKDMADALAGAVYASIPDSTAAPVCISSDNVSQGETSSLETESTFQKSEPSNVTGSFNDNEDGGSLIW